MNENLNLARIRGIGPARVRWFEETFGIRTAAELARLSPDDIERELKASGQAKISRRAVEAWLTEAGALAAGAEQPVTATGSGSVDWKSLASFVVDFQAAASGEAADGLRTSVHHLERDRTETWPGIERERLCEWMLAQLPELPPSGKPEASEAPPEPSDAGPRAAAPAERLSAEILLDHSRHGAEPIPIHAPWSVAFEWSVAAGAELQGDGEWRLDVVTQPLSQGAPPLRLRGSPVSVPADPQAKTYSERYDVAPGTVTPAHCGMPYRAVAVLTYRSSTSERAHPAGFVDLGELFFWHPGQLREAAAGVGLPPR